MNYDTSRELMVKNQIIPRGIRDERVLRAMQKVPRHLFVPESIRHRAYEDSAIAIGEGQTISQPYMVAVMTELLELRGSEKVLEVGTGSGYQAAVLAELVREVYTVERIESLAERAEEQFLSLGYTNLHVRISDGTLGWPEQAPFDRILITAGTPRIPDPLREQLADGGILLAPVGDRFSQQLLRLRKSKGEFSEEYHTPCVFVPLIGMHGWSSDDR
ncbi:MAG: protein-L-isoaspartate(D-aspartate) O-methyltransferase [Nitrospirota bacterium]